MTNPNSAFRGIPGMTSIHQAIGSAATAAQPGDPIRAAMNLYRPDAQDGMTPVQRMAFVLDAVVERFSLMPPRLRRTMLESLNAKELLLAGSISVPGLKELARANYQEAVVAGEQMNSTALLRKFSAAVPPEEGESLKAYARRLAARDFEDGAGALFANDVEMAWDEALWGESEFAAATDTLQLALFREVAAYREREQARQIAEMFGSAATAPGLAPGLQPVEDDVDPSILNLALGDLDGPGAGPAASRPRGG